MKKMRKKAMKMKIPIKQRMKKILSKKMRKKKNTMKEMKKKRTNREKKKPMRTIMNKMRKKIKRMKKKTEVEEDDEEDDEEEAALNQTECQSLKSALTKKSLISCSLSRFHQQLTVDTTEFLDQNLCSGDDRTAILCFRFIHDDSETTEDEVDLRVTDGLNSADVVLLIQASLTSSVDASWTLLMDQYLTSISIPSPGSADER